MKIIRLLKFVSVLTLVVFIVNGCGEQKKPEGEDVVSFWHFWSEPNQKRVLDSLINVFEAEYNVNVETTELSWNDGKTKLFAAFNSGTAPDVLELGSDWIGQFSGAGVLKEVDDEYIDFNKFKEFSKKPVYWESKKYAVPWLVDTRVLFINHKLLEDIGEPVTPPETYTEMLSRIGKINVKKGLYGFGATGSDSHRLYKKLLSFFWSNGGGVMNQELSPTINLPENVKALEMYAQLASNGMVETQRQLDAAFAQGKIAYWISGGWLIEKIENMNPDLEYSVGMVPGFEGHEGISFAGGEYLSINKDTENLETAKKLVKFLTDGKNAIEFCKKVNEAGFPADKEYFNAPFYYDHPKRQKFAEQLEKAKMTPVHPKWLQIESILENAAVKALYGESTPAETLSDAQEEVLELLGEDTGTQIMDE